MNEDVLQRARGVRLAIFDVDGVMTDGNLYFGARGEVMKVFHIQDGHGLKLLQESGVITALLSGRSSPAVARRAKELTIQHVIQGTGNDKIPEFEKLLKKLKLRQEQCSMMGDDIQDLPVMRRCGLAVAPSNALDSVKSQAHLVTRAHGGRGAIRELCDLVIHAQKK